MSEINVNYLQAVLLALGLAMDAAAVSAVNGFTEPHMPIWKVLLMAFFYGSFQGFMPMIGYAAGSIVVDFVSNVIPYIALVLLAILGGKMLYDGIKGEDGDDEIREGVTIKMLLIQAVATSIDALSIGIVFVEDSVWEALIQSSIIAVITFFISIAALFIGKRFGTYLNDKAQIVGGIILIAIGLKIFIEYLIDKY